MRPWTIAVGFLVLTATTVAQPNIPQIKFQSIPNFPRLPPPNYLGEAAGVAVGRQGQIYVFSRGNVSGPAQKVASAQLIELDSTGTFRREIGHNLYASSFAHAVRVDSAGNIWSVDVGSNTVVKFDPNGQVRMVLGRRDPAFDELSPAMKQPAALFPSDGQFGQPTDITWNSKDEIYISDGHANARVVKFDANGNWITTWGKPGSGNGEFNTPHGIAADADDNIYVADRGNSRIQVFDRDGKYLRQFVIKVPVPAGAQPWAGSALSSADADQENGAPAAICITPPVPGPPVVKQVLFTADWYPGRIYKVALDGTVLGVYGSSGHQLGQFGWINAIACPSENEVYVAELLNWRVQKLVVVPPSPSPDAR